MYKIRFASEAKIQFKKLKTAHKEVLEFVIDDLKETPYLGKPLQRNLSGRFSYRIGVYRIIYKIDEKGEMITILTIGHRSIVYN